MKGKPTSPQHLRNSTFSEIHRFPIFPDYLQFSPPFHKIHGRFPVPWHFQVCQNFQTSGYCGSRWNMFFSSKSMLLGGFMSVVIQSTTRNITLYDIQTQKQHHTAETNLPVFWRQYTRLVARLMSPFNRENRLYWGHGHGWKFTSAGLKVVNKQYSILPTLLPFCSAMTQNGKV